MDSATWQLHARWVVDDYMWNGAAMQFGMGIIKLDVYLLIITWGIRARGVDVRIITGKATGLRHGDY